MVRVGFRAGINIILHMDGNVVSLTANLGDVHQVGDIDTHHVQGCRSFYEVLAKLQCTPGESFQQADSNVNTSMLCIPCLRKF